MKTMNRMLWGRALAAAILLNTMAAATPLIAAPDVKAGEDAWEQGDYTKAIAEWLPLAQAGDADAQFNMGQAYRLGRGVPADLAIALDYFGRAAVQGHVRAEDNYGLLLFQQNRRTEALPYIERSARRGEPRTQYLYGTMLFNGELVAKDRVRAYAMMTRAASAGLPPAQESLRQMDDYIPEGQRRQGRALATQMEQQEQAMRLATVGTPTPLHQSPATPRHPDQPPPAAAGGPKPKAPTSSSKADTASQPKPTSASDGSSPPISSGGSWRVQLGAFSEESRAEAQWESASAKVGALAGRQHYLVKSGRLTRLQAGPLANEGEAEKLCEAVRAAGIVCLALTM